MPGRERGPPAGFASRDPGAGRDRRAHHPPGGGDGRRLHGHRVARALAVGPRQPRAGGAGPQRRQDAELSAQPRRACAARATRHDSRRAHPRHPEPVLHRHRPRHRRRDPEARLHGAAGQLGRIDRSRARLPEHVPRRRRRGPARRPLAGRRAHLPRLPAHGRAARRAGPHGPPAERRPGVGHERGRIRAGRGSPGRSSDTGASR